MNLLDIIELKKKAEVPVAEYRQIKTKSKKLERFLNSMASGPGFSLRNASMTLEVERSELYQIEKLKKDLVLRYGSLGEATEVSLGDKKLDLWDRLSETPKMEVAQLRKICDLLGFVIIPFDYLDPFSYKKECTDIKNGIKEFASQKEFQAYVLCPLPYYSFDRHIRSSDINKPIYAGRHGQAFMSLQISMPFLKTILMDLGSLKGQLSDLNTRISAAEENIKTMSRILVDLQQQVEAQQREMAIMQATIAEQRERMEKMEARKFAVDDPLMFMVEKKIDIKNGNGIAFIGPCWGPDFEDIVLVAIGLSKVEGQRSSIEKAVKQLWID